MLPEHLVYDVVRVRIDRSHGDVALRFASLPPSRTTSPTLTRRWPNSLNNTALPSRIRITLMQSYAIGPIGRCMDVVRARIGENFVILRFP